jgi:hypothetical protein
MPRSGEHGTAPTPLGTSAPHPGNSSQIGAAGLHFHDLRHTGNTLAVQTGASLRDLMTRMGHDSPRAALIYQHASANADRAIADALSKAMQLLKADMADERTNEDGEGDDGATGVLVPVG